MKIPVASPLIGGLELEYVTDAVTAGEISSMGRYVRLFEESFAAFCGTKHAISSCNGTTALHVALAGLGLGPGDEVLVPALTFISTANAVTFTGAKPVFVDVHPDHWGMDPESARRKVTARTKAVIPVHLYGHPADMDPLLRLASERKLTVIEDAAEAHGAEYKGKKVGSLGLASIFSFYGNKIITTGEGGMITTDDDALAEKIRQLKNHGADPQRRYWHPVVGYNYRMTNLQAAVGLAQMKGIEAVLARKRKIADLYRQGLKSLPLTFQPEQAWARSVHWMVCIVLNDPSNLERLKRHLEDSGVETRPIFYPLTDLPPYRESGGYPVSSRLAASGLCLPSGPRIDDGDIERVIAAVRRFFS